jgi:hypothetical protein
MGAIRGLALVLVCIVFFVGILASGVFFTISSSLEYQNFKPAVTLILKNAAESSFGLSMQMNQIYPVMASYCAFNHSVYSFAFQNYSIDLPCTTIVQGTSAVIDYGVNNAVDQTYYKKYNCNFLNCFGASLPLFLFSQHMHDYLLNKFYFLFFASIALAGLIFLLVERKSNMGIIAGVTLVLCSLIVWKMGNIFSLFAGNFASFIGVFFTSSHLAFVRMLIFGIFLLILGVFTKVFGWGVKISGIINKFKEKKEQKKIVEDVKELKKEIIEKSKKKSK